uniref:Uncharacterized protein n=1 Tax=Linum usitatissimum TaxID=4006 RepID=A0A172MLI9_LINUS|nr:hypothetical protein [Linum usitatissimum]
MTSLRPWKSRAAIVDGGKCGLKVTQLPMMVALCTTMLFIVYRTTLYQYEQTEIEGKLHPFDSIKESALASGLLSNLPRGIVRPHSDMEMKPLWSSGSSRSKTEDNASSHHYLLAMSVGINQKSHIDTVVQKVLNFFGFNGQHVLRWFAKRFLHPAVVSIYDYIFLWDEDLGVQNFDPGRRVYDVRGNIKCSEASEGPPCTGFVEGMAPVFSRSAWYCAWHLIQNDLVHGWGMDIKLGYCAQGDRTKNVGIVDSEYVVHKAIQTLGGGSGTPEKKVSSNDESTTKVTFTMKCICSSHCFSSLITFHLQQKHSGVDPRMEIRRQSTWELQVFKNRWNKAIREDKFWADPFRSIRRQKSGWLEKEKRRHSQ